MTPQHYSLRQLNLMVRSAIDTALPADYWVEAELSECREHGGHCYMELIEKDERSNTPVARAAAKCWRQTWMLLRPHFERTTGQPLRAGLKVLLRVSAQFHEAYGFSWIVSDIDPTYTVGDMARRRMEIVQQLKAEGVFDMQRELHLPLFAQRIAVISSATAAGYGDFCRQLQDNPYGLHFDIRLFPAVMQGEQVEQSIISALNAIYDSDRFDCVVIIRGGGATADMSGFDTLALAENVAQFPLPIITGIGHDRDESVLDMVSFQRVKTPTAAAAYLVEHLQRVLDAVNQAEQTVVRCVQRRLETEQMRAESVLARILALIQQRLVTGHSRIDAFAQRIPLLLERRLTAEQHRLELLAEKARSMDPARLLRRGYSMTLCQGKLVRDPKTLRAGDEIETRLEKGTIKSIIQ